MPPPPATGWEQDAVEWLLDAAPAHYQLDPALRRHPIVLARWVRERLTADLSVLRDAWMPDVDAWTAAGLPADAHQAALAMLTREGPVLAARLRSATLVAEALSGSRWVPRL